MIVHPARFPSLGVDTIADLTRTAPALYDAGIRFAVRYLGGLTASERDAILDAGLDLSLVTYSRAPGWTPAPGMGVADGQKDVSRLQALSIPASATVWIDLEGISASASDAAGWVNERAAVLAAAGYEPGLYVGAAQPMSGAQLLALPGVHAYWRSLSSGVPEPGVGWNMIQLYPTTTLAGVGVDIDVVQQDHRGRLPAMVAA